ncbi:sulfotransferase 1B1-like [Mytilus californianus]|uniref:sulfotransferase 1B1-like n=1 Tax=Mytilus californianus TaxID=6549 RepID=UPI0022483FBB|nr:sulfotransferase 1B1-like [Mytilus californianus]
MMDPKSRADGDLQLAIYPFIEYEESTYFAWPCLKENPKKQFQDIKEFPSRDDDILICTAPKTGTHWVHEIICMLVDHTTEYNSRAATLKIHLDFMTDFQLLEAENRRRILHSHLPWSFLPSKHIDKKAKVVYVNRNPKDRHVSQYNWLKEMNGVPPNWTWKQYYEDVVINDTLLTGWFNYTKEMTNAARNNKNVHGVLFEDLKLRPIETIKQLAEFLEVPFDDQFIAEVADKNVFQKLKDHKQDATVALSREYKSVLFRKGEIGDWKNWFSVSQNEQFDVMYRKEMEGVEVDFTYEIQ